MTILEFYAKHSVFEGLEDGAFYGYGFFFGHENSRGFGLMLILRPKVRAR